MSIATDGEIAVVVTTEHRGVFFGYVPADLDLTNCKERISLARCRNCLYWSRNVKGFIGLSLTGPDSDCRVGPANDLVVYAVTSIAKCSDEAVKAWESQPWG